jgi:hypothetical protein
MLARHGPGRTTDFKPFSNLRREEICTVNHFYFDTPENAADFWNRINDSSEDAKQYRIR